jgi:hypothetical protein
MRRADRNFGFPRSLQLTDETASATKFVMNGDSRLLRPLLLLRKSKKNVGCDGLKSLLQISGA